MVIHKVNDPPGDMVIYRLNDPPGGIIIYRATSPLRDQRIYRANDRRLRGEGYPPQQPPRDPRDQPLGGEREVLEQPSISRGKKDPPYLINNSPGPKS
jgi:hypothetical protein